MMKLRINSLPSTTYHLPTTNRGFTIIELVIVISIMGILLTLGVVNLRGSQANGRDAERKVDIETITQHMETFYTSGTDNSTTVTDCTGGAITHDGMYTVHKFTDVGNSTLTCTSTIVAEVFVIGGGGGGSSGGGGAGGYLTGTETLTGTMSVTVGAGGNGGISGSDSNFLTRTAKGGGKGGTSDGHGTAGGSGGGGGVNGSVNPFTLGGDASPAGQGNAGGRGIYTWWRAGAGGGGAGALGAEPVDSTHGGVGGVGLSSDIVFRGTNVSYAGGGGGGNNGANAGTASHGGGAGNGTAGTVNTGGGGGGAAGGGSTGGSGGSGIVVIRYFIPNGVGFYPSTALTASSANMVQMLRDIDIDSITAPGLDDGDDDKAEHAVSTFISATNNTVLNTASPHPTKDEYVYQPLQSDGTLCTSITQECRKFNLYYRLEVDKTVYMVTSINQ